jgi:hypothetical protein
MATTSTGLGWHGIRTQLAASIASVVRSMSPGNPSTIATS